MSRNELMTYVAAVLTTLRDLNTDCAESTVYIAVGMDLSKWETLKAGLIGAKLVTVSGFRMALTALGEQKADECNRVLAAAKA